MDSSTKVKCSEKSCYIVCTGSGGSGIGCHKPLLEQQAKKAAKKNCRHAPRLILNMNSSVTHDGIHNSQRINCVIIATIVMLLMQRGGWGYLEGWAEWNASVVLLYVLYDVLI